MEIISIVSYFSIFLTITYAFVICSFLIGWSKIRPFQPGHSSPVTTVSILIAARNEEAGIEKTISDLLAQNYEGHLLEIIIVDDHSTDRTPEIVASYADRGIRLIQLNESRALNSYKKKAIETAIHQSAGKLIVTTDADCRMGPDWLRTIVNYYETRQFKMISSPVAYFEEKNIFERLQTLEFSYLIGLGASTIGNNYPSTCNGANLAYEREAFFAVQGFKGIDQLASGDDELLLHKMAAIYEGKIGFLKNKDAIVYTHAKPSLTEFIQQRKRWASKSTHYKEKAIIALGVGIWLFNVTIIANLILALLFPATTAVSCLIFQLLLKISMEILFLNRITSFFKRKQLLVLLPLLSILHIIYMVYIGIAGNSGKYQWKNRIVK